MTAVELGLDKGADVDVVDDQTVEVAVDAQHVGPGVDDLHAAEIAVADLLSGQVTQVDAGPPEPVVLGVLGGHSVSLAQR